MLCRNFYKAAHTRFLLAPRHCISPSRFYSSKKSSVSSSPSPSSQHAEHDENLLFLHRKKMLKDWEESGKKSYENHKPTTHTIQQVREKYSHLNSGEKVEGDVVSVSGRIMSVREASSKLAFYDITSGGHNLQVMASMKQYSSPEEYTNITKMLKRGDIIHVEGKPGKTGTGELSVIPKTVSLLTPCLRFIPEPGKLINKETRYRNRHVDLLSNNFVRQAFITRSKMISFLRNYLDSRGFLEVETPILSSEVGGANARPFVTQSNSLNIPLHLRIAPELYLKRLVVGGLDRVYEIGKQFRNEGIDLTHNPEFTTCEFYQAYADYEDLMKMTEHMLCGSPKISLAWKDLGHHSTPHTENTNTTTTTTTENNHPIIDFSPPFQRISFVTKLKEILGDEFPDNFNSYDSVPKLVEACRKHKVHHSPPNTPSRLLDALFSHFIEPLCTQPTFVIDHPLVLSPLAKLHRNNPQLVERFELIVGGKELVNAYSELNDPNDQRARFVEQQKDRQEGDVEAQPPDEPFCEALEYGLPPTAGWGIGLDRVCMMLVQSNSIKDVVLFPTMRPRE